MSLLGLLLPLCALELCTGMNEESSTESTAPAHRLFSYRDIGEAIAPVAKKAKCSIVTTYCGHGIGSLFHTAPNVPHYPKNKAKGTMQPGHIFTIEPMINLGQHRDVLWPDDWTAVTADGSRSAQFEHTMLVTDNGVELLTAKPGEPIDRIEWTREKFQR